MKRFLSGVFVLLLVFLLFAVHGTLPASASGVNDPLSRLVLAYEVESSAYGYKETMHLYDLHGRLVHKSWNDGNDSIEYRYHDNGFLSEEYRYHDGENTSYVSYRKDGTLFYKASRDSTGWAYSEHYDSYGNLESKASHHEKSGNYSEILYINEYDTKGRLIQQTGYIDEVLYVMEKRTYSNNGSYTVDRSTYSAESGTEKVNIHVKETYNKKGLITSSLMDILDENPYYSKTSYRYDSHGNLTQVTDQTGNNGDSYYFKEVKDYKNFYTKGVLTEVHCYSSSTIGSGKDQEKIAKHYTGALVYEYDNEGNLTFYCDGVYAYSYVYLPLSEVLAP